MLEKPTVLILGAGASAPFGFPTGIELSRQLVAELRPGHAAFKSLQDCCEFLDEQIAEFRDAFLYSGKNSIDAFLEHRTEFLTIGKTATAALLINYERAGKLFDFDNSWLRYLYNRLNTSFEEFDQHQLSIVTFNYDRTVEHFFFTSLKNSYGRPDEECKDALSNIPFIHLHGSLGDLPWQGKNGRDFSPHIDRDTLSVATQGIKIIHEKIDDGRDKDFERAKSLMSNSKQIFLMGFGFNRTNIERLGLNELNTHKTMGTCVGLNAQERSAARRLCAGKVKLVDEDCLTFMRHFLQLA